MSPYTCKGCTRSVQDGPALPHDAEGVEGRGPPRPLAWHPLEADYFGSQSATMTASGSPPALSFTDISNS